VTLSDPEPRFQGHGYIHVDALDVLCAELTRDLFAIAKFLLTASCGLSGSLQQQGNLLEIGIIFR